MNFTLTSVAHDLLVWVKGVGVLGPIKIVHLNRDGLSTPVILRHSVAI